MATTQEEILTILNNSQTPPQLTVTSSVSSDDLIVVWSTANQELQQTTANNLNLTNSSNFISIGNDIFRHIKGYTGATKNSTGSLEANDVIGNGVIRNNNVNLLIVSAVYNGGTITDFGTYNSATGDFTGGSYTVLNWQEL